MAFSSPQGRYTTDAELLNRHRPSSAVCSHMDREDIPVDNGGAGGAGDAVVVGLAQAADGRDAGLGQEVHGQVAEALLRDHQVRLVLGNLRALPLYVVLLQLQQSSPAAISAL